MGTALQAGPVRMSVAGICVAVAAIAVPAAAPGDRPDPEPPARVVTLPTANAAWDYQIGGAFRPAPAVSIVTRDRNDLASAGDYSICYVNAFQTQPDEKRFWVDDPKRWRLVLKDANGDPVVDGAWGEFLLDTTAGKRDALRRIVGRWIDRCAADGFEAVEFDSLDSWDRARGLISRTQNKAFARLLTARAHKGGMAAAQKNWAGLSPEGPDLGFDFAVAEECGRYSECGTYARAYDERVYVVEYRDRDFENACDRWGSTLSIVCRDRDVTPTGVNRRC